MSETLIKPAPKKKVPKGTVRNLKRIPLNLTSGVIAPGNTGIATPAEITTLAAYLEPVV